MRLLLPSLLILSSPLFATEVAGRVTDGIRGIPGVRVYPDRTPRVRPTSLPPVTLTDTEGRFQLDLSAFDDVLVMEKEGWQRDLVPVAALTAPAVLHKAPAFRSEKVLVVRLTFTDQFELRSDDDVRGILFNRAPGVASAASYFYEVSKGSLLLEEGAILTLKAASPRGDEQRQALVRSVLEQIRDLDLADFDRVDNKTGRKGRDRKPDHLWIVPPGSARNVSLDPQDFSAISFLMPLPWKHNVQWSVLFMPEDTPLGNIVHEAFHAMGEHRVDDLYLDADHPLTAGIWDLMDAGQYRGWDRAHPGTGPYQEDTGYSPSQPMPWVRTDLWYRGAFKHTVSSLVMRGSAWCGWLAPLERVPASGLQALRVPDPRKKDSFWEFSVRRPWGFDRGRVGGRFNTGHEGLIVAHVQPSLLSTDGASLGPVRVVDAHPNTPAPPSPHFPNGRWELDDAAFSLGPEGADKGQDGPLRWEILQEDALGRIHVRVRLMPIRYR